jgi:antitoxin PrlF
MPTTLTVKGQVTIPKAVRDHLGLRAGSRVSFERRADGEIVLRPVGSARPRGASPFGRLRGRATVKMSTHQIMALTRG